MEESSNRSTALLSSYFPSLDGVRAFSVFFVIFTHVQKHGVTWYFPGWLGVDIFFVLSGFLITYLLFREESKMGSIDMGAFYIRRAFRILPIYLLVLSIYVILAYFSSQPEKWAEMKAGLPYFLTFMNDLAFVNPNSPVKEMFGLSWTLGVEEKFYLLWPLLLFVLAKSLKARASIQVVSLAFTALAAFFIAHVLGIDFTQLGKLPRANYGLLVGSALAVLFSSRWAQGYKRFVSRLPWGLLLLVFFAVFVAVQFQPYLVYLFSWVVFILISHLLLVPSALNNFLSYPAFVWIGKRSYCMYLLQGFGINFVQLFIHPFSAAHQIEIALLAFILALGGAAILHILVEEPGRQLGKRLLSHRSQRRESRILSQAAVPVARD